MVLRALFFNHVLMRWKQISTGNPAATHLPSSWSSLVAGDWSIHTLINQRYVVMSIYATPDEPIVCLKASVTLPQYPGTSGTFWQRHTKQEQHKPYDDRFYKVQADPWLSINFQNYYKKNKNDNDKNRKNQLSVPSMSNGWSPPQPLRDVVVVGCRDLRNLVHCLLLSLLEGSGPCPRFQRHPQHVPTIWRV